MKHEWNTFDAGNYSIQFPDGFELDSSGKTGAIFLFFPKQDTSPEGFRTNINIHLQDLSQNKIDLETYVEITKSQIQTMVENGRLMESTRVKQEEKEYHIIVYTGTFNQMNMKWFQHYHIQHDTAYILTLTCPEEEFDLLLSIGQQIISTFSFSE